MNPIEFVSQYPKAIASLLLSIVVYYLSGKIPDELLSPEMTEHLRLLLTGVLVAVFGRFTRLSKENAVEFNQFLQTKQN